MASAEAYDAIHDHLVANFGAIPVAFENDGFKPPKDPDYWVLIEIEGGYFDQASIGAETVLANLWREEGTVYARVKAPRGSGSRQARSYATEICDLFRGQEIAGVVFGEMSIGSDPASGMTDGSYYEMTARIDWRRDI